MISIHLYTFIQFSHKGSGNLYHSHTHDLYHSHIHHDLYHHSHSHDQYYSHSHDQYNSHSHDLYNSHSHDQYTLSIPFSLTHIYITRDLDHTTIFFQYPPQHTLFVQFLFCGRNKCILIIINDDDDDDEMWKICGKEYQTHVYASKNASLRSSRRERYVLFLGGSEQPSDHIFRSLIFDQVLFTIQTRFYSVFRIARSF